jgi:hypothetical protein
MPSAFQKWETARLIFLLIETGEARAFDRFVSRIIVTPRLRPDGSVDPLPVRANRMNQQARA